MASIAIVIQQIKKDPSHLLDHLPIRQVCDDLELDFRVRALDPATTVALFIKQIIHGNSSCAAVRHLNEKKFSAQAYCKARQRLSLQVIQRLSRRLCEGVRHLRQSRRQDLLLTHRVFVVDGSSFSMPDTQELQTHFGQSVHQAAGCGFPTAHLLAMFDLSTGMFTETVASPMRTHDLTNVSRMHPLLQEGDLLLGDTAFGSYAHFALLLQAGLHGLMPNHQQRIVDFTPGRAFARPGERGVNRAAGLPRSRWIKSLGRDDQRVEWFRPTTCPAFMSPEQYQALPASIIVRELRRRVHRPELNRWVELIIVTTLLDEKIHPADQLVELRLRRWQAEINLRHLKSTMGMETLKCKTVQGVQKELAMYMLVYNLVRVLMIEAARRQKTRPDRISFADVLFWIRVGRADGSLPCFATNPIRRNRVEPPGGQTQAQAVQLVETTSATNEKCPEKSATHGVKLMALRLSAYVSLMVMA